MYLTLDEKASATSPGDLFQAVTPVIAPLELGTGALGQLYPAGSLV
jgi:hypothetical protein